MLPNSSSRRRLRRRSSVNFSPSVLFGPRAAASPSSTRTPVPFVSPPFKLRSPGRVLLLADVAAAATRSRRSSWAAVVAASQAVARGSWIGCSSFPSLIGMQHLGGTNLSSHRLPAAAGLTVCLRSFVWAAGKRAAARHIDEFLLISRISPFSPLSFVTCTMQLFSFYRTSSLFQFFRLFSLSLGLFAPGKVLTERRRNKVYSLCRSHHKGRLR